MSTAEPGIVGDVAEAARGIQAALDDQVVARAEELRQLELEDPITGEEMVAARTELGPVAGRLAVLARARENRGTPGRGRPPGSRNRATAELGQYLRQFGTDPLVGAMILQSEPPEVLAERWGCKVIEVIDRQLRSRELLAPYMHGKKPVAVDLTFTGVSDLFIEGVTHSRDEIGDILEGDYLPVPDDGEGEA